MSLVAPKPVAPAEQKQAGEEEATRFSSPPLTQLLSDLSLKNSSTTAVVYRVVLTGGPCAGKTSAMGTLTERFQALGWRVFRVPEAATMLLSGGHSFANLNKLQQYQFQAALLKLMLSLEEAFITLARSTHEKCIVLCDRGTMDARSYMPEDEWEQLTKEIGSSTMELRDNRYDCVVHMVTAANGASEFYTTEGHAARSEPPEFARELDTRVKNNWVGHPHFYVVDNSTDFNGKIRRVMSTICQFVGLRGNIGMSKRKFLIKSDCIKMMGDPDSKKGDRIVFPDEIRYQRFDVEHDYILRPDQESGHQLRLRRRGFTGQYTYSYTLRYPDLLGQRVELKRLVNRREYYDLLLQRDPATQTIHKKRYSFLFQDIYYELDQYINPHRGLYLLELYAEKERNLDGLLPDFLEVEREVTHDKEFSMYHLARVATEEPETKPKNKGRSMSLSQNGEQGPALHTQQHLHHPQPSGHNLQYAYASAPTSPQIKPFHNSKPFQKHEAL